MTWVSIILSDNRMFMKWYIAFSSLEVKWLEVKLWQLNDISSSHEIYIFAPYHFFVSCIVLWPFQDNFTPHPHLFFFPLHFLVSLNSVPRFWSCLLPDQNPTNPYWLTTRHNLTKEDIPHLQSLVYKKNSLCFLWNIHCGFGVVLSPCPIFPGPQRCGKCFCLF